MVSIIVATYNGEKYLAAQLASIASQTYNDIEVIICDDKSTDNTVQIIKDFAENNKNVSYYINEQNIGVNKNFENGFLKAAGDYIAIADQDDIWLPNKIEEQIKLFTTPEIVLTHSLSARFSGVKLPTKKYNYSSNLFEGNNVRKLLLRNSVSGHNIIFRKQLLNKVLPIPEDIYYDWWLVQTAACNGQVAATNKVFAYQRAHENNITVKERTSVFQTEAEYKERITALHLFLKIKGLGDNDKKFIETLIEQFKKLEGSTFSKDLFHFLMKNKHILFYYKKGLLKYFSQKKAAFRMSHKVKE